MASARVRRWRDRILLAAGLGLLVYVISRFPLSTIVQACYDVGPAALVTPLIAIVWYAANSAALGVVLDGHVPIKSLLWNRIIGEGFNALIPAAGVGGEPFKMRHLTRFVPKGAVVVALINDYIIENIVALGTSAVFIAIALWELPFSTSLRDASILYVVLAPLVALAGTIVVLAGVPSRIGARFKKWLVMIPEGARVRPIKLLRALAWCTAARVIGFIETALLLWVLGIEPTPMRVLFLAGWTAAAGFVGMGVPQGIGVTEAATVAAFGVLHLPGPAAIAFALARRGRTLFMSLLGVVLYLGWGRTREETPATATVPTPVDVPADRPA